MTGNRLSPGISIIIPVYNSESSLQELALRLAQTLPALGEFYQVILVNDGSQDGSWQRVSELVEQHTWISGINLMRNYGQHNALLCGIRSAKFDTIVTMDDDLQHPPEEIPLLLEKLAQGYDVIYGTPRQQQHGIWRNTASWVTKLALQGAMGADTVDDLAAYAAHRIERIHGPLGHHADLPEAHLAHAFF